MKVKAGAGPFGCHGERGVETRIVRIFTPYGPLCEIAGMDLAFGWSG
jgi:membrane-associated protease RseP (regulator of RpoE activity)